MSKVHCADQPVLPAHKLQSPAESGLVRPTPVHCRPTVHCTQTNIIHTEKTLSNFYSHSIRTRWRDNQRKSPRDSSEKIQGLHSFKHIISEMEKYHTNCKFMPPFLFLWSEMVSLSLYQNEPILSNFDMSHMWAAEWPVYTECVMAQSFTLALSCAQDPRERRRAVCALLSPWFLYPVIPLPLSSVTLAGRGQRQYSVYVSSERTSSRSSFS